jgi:hypothetical protein
VQIHKATCLQILGHGEVRQQHLTTILGVREISQRQHIGCSRLWVSSLAQRKNNKQQSTTKLLLCGKLFLFLAHNWKLSDWLHANVQACLLAGRQYPRYERQHQLVLLENLWISWSRKERLVDGRKGSPAHIPALLPWLWPWAGFLIFLESVWTFLKQVG